jgi:hypothetical protein
MSDYIIDVYTKHDYKASRPHPIGRPPKLTSEMIEQICDLLIQGRAIAKAAMFTGISESTIFRWLAMGKLPEAEPIYRELVDRVAEATECSEFELLQNIRIAAADTKNWRANFQMLERRFPEKYGKSVSPQDHGQSGKPDSGPTGLAAVK